MFRTSEYSAFCALEGCASGYKEQWGKKVENNASFHLVQKITDQILI